MRSTGSATRPTLVPPSVTTAARCCTASTSRGSSARVKPPLFCVSHVSSLGIASCMALPLFWCHCCGLPQIKFCIEVHSSWASVVLCAGFAGGSVAAHLGGAQLQAGLHHLRPVRLHPVRAELPGHEVRRSGARVGQHRYLETEKPC